MNNGTVGITMRARMAYWGKYFVERYGAEKVQTVPSIEIALLKNKVFTLDWDIFWRHRTSDGIYGPSLTLERGSEGPLNTHYIGY